MSMQNRRVFLWGICILSGVMMLGVGGCASNPIADPRKEILLGEEQAPLFAKEGGGAVADEKLQAYVKKLGMDLVEQIKPEHRRGLPWVFTVLNSENLNAFALPGGKVFVTRGLVEKMTNEAQLSAALGHEVGHVVAEHIGEQMAKRENQRRRSIGVSVASEYAGVGWVGSGFNMVDGLIVLKFGREQELEADSIGMVFMNRLGYDPQGMIQLLGILAEASKGGRSLAMLSTHPDPQRRLEDARKLLASAQFSAGGRGTRLGAQEFGVMLKRLKAVPPPPKPKAKTEK